MEMQRKQILLSIIFLREGPMLHSTSVYAVMIPPDCTFSSISRQFQEPMRLLLRHLKQKPVSGKRHPASLQRKIHSNTNSIAKFSVFLELFSTRKRTGQQLKTSNFIVMMVFVSYIAYF